MNVNLQLFMIKNILLMPLLLVCFICTAQVQELKVPAIPAMRQIHHEYILRSLEAITALKNDAKGLTQITIQSTEKSVTQLRAFIELSDLIDNNAKYTWLRGVNEILTGFTNAFQTRSISGEQLPILVNRFDSAMQLQLKGNSFSDIVKESTLEAGTILVANFALQTNRGMALAKDALLVKQCERTPARILNILLKNPTTASADSLIIKAAFRDPEELYSYAAAPDPLGKKIQSVNHPFVKLVSRLAVTRTGRMYFPFLDNLYKGKISMDSITRNVSNDTSVGYYRLLVKTRIDYAARMQKGDTPMAVKVLTNKLKSKGIELYINEINALHNERSDIIRFKKIEVLTPEELYYLAVVGEEEMYTSSFVNGVYPRIFSKMNIPRSDSLLKFVTYDYYKKFLKIAAAYNKLDDFLARMDKRDAELLMKGFVNGLEKTTSLEDAVDVADSYSSIYNVELRKLMLKQVQAELIRVDEEKQKRGQVIYGILNTIFLSWDPANKIDLTKDLGILPIFELPYTTLRDSITGRVVMQQFFYGDKDGAVVFNAFLNKFKNTNWRITKKSQWVEVSSVKGTPVIIYANLPLDETLELDEQSQDSLIEYLNKNNINPTVAIHRGHSYYLNQTVKKMPSTAKLILLGSCGGFQKLNEVLEICPGAHIISSKQIGTGIINQGLINVISEELRLGKNLNWPALWNSLAIRFSGTSKEKFDDYVPPYKNLGAIFITAYNKRMLE